MSMAGGAVAAVAPSSALPLRKLFALLTMIFGMFMAILDIQIVSASLAEIQAGLGATADEISWVQTAYIIAEVIMIPLSGYLSRALSTRVFFSLSALGFTAASVMCAQAGSIGEMIVWRAAQGFLGGGMIPGVFAAAFSVFPREKRYIIQPIIGLVATLAPTLGPTIGGYLSEMFSWHWLFLINVVPGLCVTVAAWFLIDFDEPNHALLRVFDWTGLVALAAFLGCLEYVLEEGSRYDWFDDQMICNLSLVAVLGGAVFFWRALTREEPIVDLSTFADRNFMIGSVFVFITGIGLYCLVYLYPVYLSRVRGLDALQIGKTMFVTGLFQFMTAPLAAFLMQRLDSRFIMAIGFSLFGLSTFLTTGITRVWDFEELFLPQALRGMALMLSMTSIQNIAMGTLPHAKLKAAAGLYNVMRNLGGAIGLAVLNTLLNKRTDLHIARLHEALPLGHVRAEEFLQALTEHLAPMGDIASTVALRQLSMLVHREAMVMAFADVFALITVLMWTLVLLVPALRKPQDL